MEKAIQELLDKQAITELMIRYAERIDANDPEGAAACFAEDGVDRNIEVGELIAVDVG